MLEYLHIKNFKTILAGGFELSGLNIFSGLNGMGKSSLIQTLLLLRQSYERNLLVDKGLLLQGDYVSLGTGRDVLSQESQEDEFSFIVKWTNSSFATEFSFDYADTSDLQPMQKLNPAIIEHAERLSLFNNNFRYLSADRVAPTSHHQLSEFHIKELNSLGIRGEYTVHYIAEYADQAVSNHPLIHKEAASSDLLTNINAWMSEIAPGLRVRTQAVPHFNAATLGFSFVQGNQVTNEFKPQNVGFGLSYVLPVVTSILSAKPGDLLIIENPESHLHPAGQAVMGRLCALAAHHGIQLIVESHSDHFLNGVRVAVKEQLATPDDVRLYFLERESTDQQHASHILRPKIDEQGRIDQWPNGFFDEWDKQLDRLL
ncbi:DUF3696 domain-containing protein [Pelagibaculum spongiae]|uniref:DUF3696 domain-containing protein n=1 Tax=Pelagibaculum spongiae TaxID=2080658 RepID=A0A2V1H335_9GAMM|nr:DUF3696 domain-containing protein [Pelagibaculum spongiae]PVZ70419.1 DUF3696 domain-containing protein [Pelagibaculum spongiae]